MTRFTLPALAAGLLLATTALAAADDDGDAPRSRGHALGAEMAAAFAPKPQLHPGQSIGAAPADATGCAAGAADCVTAVALDR